MPEVIREITVVSGKGGAGKTTLVASLVALAQPVVCADCDVDAPNLHLLLLPEEVEATPVYAASVAERDPAQCRGAGVCEERCRFGAITRERVIVHACEGCGLCVAVCPHGALRLVPALTGHVHVAPTRYGAMVHARLAPGGEGSGRLVTEVRRLAVEAAQADDRALILIDGPPGIGCSAIASMVDTDLVLLVAEPTLSGLHDLVRVAELGRQLRVPMGVVLNKSDLSESGARAVREYAREAGIPLLAELPYDEAVAWAIVNQTPLVEVDAGPVARAIRTLWERLTEMLVGETANRGTGASGAARQGETR